MNDTLRQRLLRHIEALPEEQVYRALDYVEFLASKYNREGVRAARPWQRFGEVFEDNLRRQGVGMRAIRGTMGVVGTADRVFSGIADAGRTLLREVDSATRPPGAAGPEARSEDVPLPSSGERLEPPDPSTPSNP